MSSKWDNYANSGSARLGDRHCDPRLENNGNVSFHLAPGDSLLVCPYEPKTHHILEARFSTHLSKCMRNYEAKRIKDPSLPKMVPCQYNWKHHVVVDLLDEHLRVCPDAERALQEDALLWVGLPRAPAVQNPIVVVPKAPTPVVKLDNEDEESDNVASGTSRSYYNTVTGQSFTMPPQEEDWEAEPPACPADQPFYDPKRVLEEKHVFFMPPGLAPAERKKYRARLVAQYYAQEHEHELPPNPFNN